MSAPFGRRAAAVASLFFLLAAAYVVLIAFHRPAPFPAFDLYIYFIPNKLHAVYGVWHGGKGLLWNPYQACGEPFFANPAMGLLYPPHLLFLVLEPNAAVHAVLIVNMVVGALGMLFLARATGLGTVAALTAALAFELGDGMMQLTGWSPMHSGPWAWVPWALFFCERLLRAPSRRGVIGLALVLAVGLLPGWALLIAITYQLIALRVIWEVVTCWSRPPWRGIAAVVLGLAVAPLLVAVQLLPAAELAGESQRVAFDFADFWAYGGLTTDVAASIRGRVPPVPFIAVPLLLAVVAPLIAGHRRLLGFYAVVGMVFGCLALGPVTPLFSLYVRLPPGGATLRYPNRLFWITGFSLVMISAFGVDGVTRRRGHWLGAIVALAGTTALYLLAPGGLRGGELIGLAAVVGALFAASVRPAMARPAAWVVGAGVLVNLVAVPIRFPGRLLPDVSGLWRHADGFAALRSRMSPQDRVFIEPSIGSMFDLGLLTKTASIARIPDVYDYEPLIGYRLGNYFSAMWHGSPIISGRALVTEPTVMAGFRSRLSELASIRYVVSTTHPSFSTRDLDLSSIEVGDPDLHVYAARSAFPRARYVPRIAVVEDPGTLLNRLAYGNDDLAAIAFVEEPFPSGFTGGAGTVQSGTVRFVRNDPEDIELDVDAPAHGFVLLADQHASGWRASVNGSPTAIRRANYAFRAIEVPAGASHVEFRYRPVSVAIGAGVSATTVAVLILMLLTRSGHRAGRWLE